MKKILLSFLIIAILAASLLAWLAQGQTMGIGRDRVVRYWSARTWSKTRIWGIGVQTFPWRSMKVVKGPDGRPGTPPPGQWTGQCWALYVDYGHERLALYISLERKVYQFY